MLSRRLPASTDTSCGISSDPSHCALSSSSLPFDSALIPVVVCRQRMRLNFSGSATVSSFSTMVHSYSTQVPSTDCQKKSVPLRLAFSSESAFSFSVVRSFSSLRLLTNALLRARLSAACCWVFFFRSATWRFRRSGSSCLSSFNSSRATLSSSRVFLSWLLRTLSFLSPSISCSSFSSWICCRSASNSASTPAK